MTNPSASTPDAVPGSWVERAPERLRPWLRLARADRPIGVWLLYIPCLWGLALAAVAGHGGSHLFWYAALFGAGAYVMRSAGCTYNDIVDRKIDAQVARTAERPIASGRISVRAAWAFLVGLSLVGLVILLQFNRLAIVVGLSSLALVAAYPFMKRITWWPQAWLGLTFNWGALVAYAAAAGALDPAALALYAAGFFWTLVYDTIYAHQDKEDDALVGVKSAALRLGPATKRWLTGFAALALLLFALAGFLGGGSAVFMLALAPAALHFRWQIHRLDIDDPQTCLKLFRSNRETGLLLLLAPLCEVGARLL